MACLKGEQMTSTINNNIPTVPGIAGLGNLSLNAAWGILNKKGEAAETAAVAATPQVKAAKLAFDTAVKNDTTVDQFLKDTKALNYLLTAYGLGSQASAKGIIKKVLTEDPTAKTSLVNKLADPRWKQLATDTDFFDDKLNKLKSKTVTDTFTTTTAGNNYLQVFQLDSSGKPTNSLYANSFNLSIASNGTLTTSQGYALAGIPYDNQGELNASSLNNTTTINDNQSRPQTVTQNLTQNNDGTWNWKITDSSNDVLYNSKNVALTFDPNGNIKTVNGSDPTSQVVTLNWPGNHTTSQTFDLTQLSNTYQSSDLQVVNVNALANKTTPTKNITPNISLSASQTVDSRTSYHSTALINTDVKNADGSTAQAVVTQKFTQNGDGTWNWQITNPNGDTLYNQANAALTFNTDGTIATVNGTDPKSQNLTLNWPDGGTTNQSFDLTSIFNQADFTQNSTIVDNSGASHVVKLNYTKINDANNQWQVSIVDNATGNTYGTVAFGLNSSGKVTGVGTYDPNTGKISQADGQTNATTQQFNINWGGAGGISNLNLNFDNIVSSGSSSTQIQPTQTDSVALGARTAVNIDNNGVVSATYANASGTGSTTVNLYRLAVNNFSSVNNLTSVGTTGYFSANANTGTDHILPLGSQTNQGSIVHDSNGKVIAAFGGTLSGTPKTTSTITTLQKIDNKYAQDILQEALGQENQSLRYAQYFKDNIGNIKNVDQLLSSQALATVVQTVGALPNGIYSQQLGAQESAFGKSIDFKKVTDPDYVNNYINKFLAIVTANDPNSGGSIGWQASLLSSSSGPDDSGNYTVDFSGLSSAIGSSLSIHA